MMKRSTATAAVLLAATLAAVSGACRPREGGVARRPNVVLVTLDTTRADRLGCYGAPAPGTPNFDRLAREGIQFDMAIASSAVTPPSHASILTGLQPQHHGVRVLYAASGYRLASTTPTLAAVLRGAGWRTGAFLSAFPVSSFFGFDQGFDAFDGGPAGRGMIKTQDGAWDWDVAASQRRSDKTTDRAIDWLSKTPSPFFLWVHYWDPHDDVLTPPPEVLAPFHLETGDHDQRRRRLYDAEVFYVDQQFGRLVESLQKEGRLDDTIVVVVGDHGEGLGDHDWWYHRILYQEQIRVPLIVRLPGGPRGRVVPDLVRLVDIFPTILQAVGIAPPKPVDGVSLQGLLEGRPNEPRRLAYADALNLYDLAAKMLRKRPQDDLLYCETDGRWKLIYRPRRPDTSELYDLQADPREQVNRFRSAPVEARRLLDVLQKSGGFVERPFGEGRDADALERLRSLGYVGGPAQAPPR